MSTRTHHRHRLRTRIVVSFLLLGTLLSVLFAFFVGMTQNRMEHQLIGKTLQQDLRSYMENVRSHPDQTQPGFYRQIDGYVVRPGRMDILPLELHDLDSGIHQVKTKGGSYLAVVEKEPDLWGYLVYNLNADALNWHTTAKALLIAVAVFSLLSWTLGVWSAARVMSPVSDLARRIPALEAGNKDHPLADSFADDEVGELAQALDRYAGKVAEMLEHHREFNANVSHELRTPLTVIKGASELVLNQADLPERTRERIERIARAARQGADLTTALLHLAREGTGCAGEPQELRVADVVTQAIENERVHLLHKPVNVSCKVSYPTRLFGSAAALSVAVSNLISNAFKYTREGTVSVEVADGKVVVSDTGPGIPEADIDKVFTRHFRGGSASGAGAGLGLAIVQRLCDLYGWSVHVVNRSQGGLVAILKFDSVVPAMRATASKVVSEPASTVKPVAV